MGALRVLIVDDSVVFRSQIKAALQESPLIEVVGVANNGRIALEKLAQGSIDLVTLDMEMPEMGGLETLKAMRKAGFRTRVIFFSSHTTRGSEAALEALSAGAEDFVAKPTSEAGSEFTSAAERVRSELLPKVLQFVENRNEILATPNKAQSLAAVPKNRRDLATFLPQCIVIGSSTGGPPALEQCLSGIAQAPRVPIFIAQHMPPVFTASLAKRLGDATGVEAAEGKSNELVVPRRIYVAPGDYHMSLKKDGADVRIQLDRGPQRNSVRPAVDNLFESAAEVYGSRCLAVVLTGMGEDGKLGCRAVKQAGGGVMIQNKESSVVFGMPGAVFEDGCFDDIGALATINQLLKRVTA